MSDYMPYTIIETTPIYVYALSTYTLLRSLNQWHSKHFCWMKTAIPVRIWQVCLSTMYAQKYSSY